MLAQRSTSQARSSAALLELVDGALRESGVALTELGGVLALRGPGSFTGLRVGLATVLGLHQALGFPASALPTLRVLAAGYDRGSGRVLAAVDALRDEWFVQPYRIAGVPCPLAPARRVHQQALPTLECRVIVGFGVGRLAAVPGWSIAPELIQPTALAPLALKVAAAEPPSWDPSLLVSPLYLRPPATTVPAP